LRDLFLEYLREPQPERYRQLREERIRHPTYDAYSAELDDIEDLHGEEKFAEVRQRLQEAMPNLLLSPRGHLLAAMAADKLGDKDASEIEGFIYARCIEGILSTGDGSEGAPYLVTRTSDEYDVLMHTRRQLQQQRLLHRGEKSYDVLTCEDETEVWFDISDPFRTLRRHFGPGDQVE